MDIFWGELLGTLVMMLLGNGVVANVLLRKSKGEKSGWIVITSGWAFAVMVAVYLVGWASGAHLNPAVTVGLTLAGLSEWPQLPYYVTGQLVGAFLGSALVWVVYFPHFRLTEDRQLKFLCFATRPAIRSFFWNFMTELVATAILILGILGIFDPHNEVILWAKPLIVGLLIFSIGLSLGGPTGFAINPARDLGPRLAHALLPISGKGTSDWAYSWIPIAAPLLGSALGAGIYGWMLKILSIRQD